MARKFGYNFSNKRNREIFGPSMGQIIGGGIVAILLVILLVYMLGGEEDSTQLEETDEEEATYEEPPSRPTTRAQQGQQQIVGEQGVIGECPLPSIPIVEFTEATVFGDTTEDDQYSGTCKLLIEESKRLVAKAFSDAKNDEAKVLMAEERLADEIKDLEKALKELYQEQNNLEYARTCSGELDVDPEEEARREAETATEVTLGEEQNQTQEQV